MHTPLLSVTQVAYWKTASCFKVLPSFNLKKSIILLGCFATTLCRYSSLSLGYVPSSINNHILVPNGYRCLYTILSSPNKGLPVARHIYCPTNISMARSKTKTTPQKEDNGVDSVDAEDVTSSVEPTTGASTSRKRRSGARAVSNEADNKDNVTATKASESSTGNKRRSRSQSSKKSEAEDADDNTADNIDIDTKANTNTNAESVPTTAKRKPKPPPHQVLTEKDDLPKLWNDAKASMNHSYTFKVASWNVAGIRAVLTKTPNVFKDFVARHDIDILCLQETKLQEQHLDDPKLNIKETIGLQSDYDDHWSCSTTKKGYSGTAVFIRRRKSSSMSKDKTVTNNSSNGKGKGGSSKKQTSMLQFVKSSENMNIETAQTKLDSDEPLPIDVDLLIPTGVSYGMGNEKHDGEGRIIVVDYPLFTLCNVYVPNAGQNLERLSYRVNEWDKDFLQFIHDKRTTRNGLPVIWLGDLNVAHTHLEVWNDGAKHLPKQAGVTPEERASFQQQLDVGHVDAFRYLHPTASGHYSYWSMRAGNRAVNKGLRLDYFICDSSMFDNDTSPVLIRDCYMDSEQLGSDHCPVILEIEVKGHA